MAVREQGMWPAHELWPVLAEEGGRRETESRGVVETGEGGEMDEGKRKEGEKKREEKKEKKKK
jgi:hypothetical protein